MLYQANVSLSNQDNKQVENSKVDYQKMNLLHFITETLNEGIGIVAFPRKNLRRLYGVSLYRNAVYLIVNNVILSATGFIFWIVAARLYSADAVGLASGVISAIYLLTLLSTMGLDYSLIRFLPNAGEEAKSMVNTCFTIGGMMSSILAIVFIVGLGFWSPALTVIREQPVFALVFLLAVVALTINNLIVRSFVARRRSGFTLVQGLIFSIFRLIPLAILAAFFESFGIVASWGIALMIAVVSGILFMVLRTESGYTPFPIIRRETFADMLRFSLSNYLSTICWAAPQFILPIMVVNILSKEENAYFYVAWAMAYMLFMIPMAVSNSLFAEGSHNEKRISGDVAKSLKIVIILLVPAVVVMVVIGGSLLQLFGADYSQNATHLLWILALAALPMSINQIYFGVKRVRMQMKEVVWLSFFMLVIALGLSCILLPGMGIEGGGVAWLISQSVVAMYIGVNYYLGQRKTTLSETV